MDLLKVYTEYGSDYLLWYEGLPVWVTALSWGVMFILAALLTKNRFGNPNE